MVAGLLGAVLVLPQGVAFATLAGLPAQYGIYAAVVPCMVAALGGSSWHVMSGPTNANSLALLAMLAPMAAAGSPAYIQLALAVTILVGVLQLLVGVLRLGSVANFISPTVLLGFTCGAATLIAIYALKDILGLQVAPGTKAFGILRQLAATPGDIRPDAVLVSVVTMTMTLIVKRINHKWPFMLAGLFGGYLSALLVNQSGAHHVAVVGLIPSPFPPFEVPKITWRDLPDLLGIAAALTIVALGQSISIAKAVALRSGQHIDANREFIGQGLSNIAGGFFSSYVSCGSLNRSLPNFEAGAQTPLASVFSSILLVGLVFLSAPLLAQIPLAAIGAMLLLVAYGLFDVVRIKRLLALSRIEALVAAATFIATIAIRLEVAILLGTVLSLTAYLYRTSRPAIRTLAPEPDAPGRPLVPIDELPAAERVECPQLKLIRVEGSVYFGAVQHVTEILHSHRAEHPSQKYVLAMTKSMNFIDIAGEDLWETELSERRAHGGDLYFHRPRREVLKVWQTSGFIDRLGRDHIFPSKEVAIKEIYKQMDPEVCVHCKVRLFEECLARPQS